MLKSVCGAILFALTLTSAPAAAESEFKNDEQAVTERVMDYFWARQNGDQERAERAFDTENGHLKWVGQADGTETLNTMTLSDFAARMTKPLDGENVGRIVSMDVVDSKMAWVKFSLIAEDGGEFVDYLLLYKRNGNWSVVNKMSIRR